MPAAVSTPPQTYVDPEVRFPPLGLPATPPAAAVRPSPWRQLPKGFAMALVWAGAWLSWLHWSELTAWADRVFVGGH